MTGEPAAPNTQTLILENGQTITADEAAQALAERDALRRAQAAIEQRGGEAGLEQGQVEMLVGIIGMFGGEDNQMGDTIGEQLAHFYQRGQNVSATIVDGELGIGTFLNIAGQDGGPLEIPDSLIEQFSRIATEMIVQDPSLIDQFLPEGIDDATRAQITQLQETLRTGTDAEKQQAETFIYQFLASDPNSPVLTIAAGAMDQGREFLVESGLMEYVQMAVDTVENFAQRAGINLNLDSMFG